MTLIQLQYMLAVAEHGNFTLAAEKSFATQPTLSMQIQKLEKELEVAIFDRSSQPITLTKVGEKIVEQAKKILFESKNMYQLVEEEKNSISGTYIIGVIPTVISTLVPIFLKTFRDKFPKINLSITEMKTEKMIADIKNGKIDFGLAATPLLEEVLIEKPLYYEPLLAYVPEGHPLSQKKELKTKELDIENLLLLKEGHCFRNNVMSVCEPKNFNNRPLSLDISNFNTLIKLSNDGFGMTMIPALHKDDLSTANKKQLKNFQEPVPTREISLIYHKNQIRLSFAKELAQTIQGLLRGKIFMESDNVTSPRLRLAK